MYVHVITTFSYPWCSAARASGARAPLLGSLSSDVFERRTSTGSDPFSLLISLDATIFVLPRVLILIETICSKICSKSRLKNPESPLSVNVRRSKASLLKLPIYGNSSLNALRSSSPVATGVLTKICANQERAIILLSVNKRTENQQDCKAQHLLI